MSVVIKKIGSGYTWICKIPVVRDGKTVPCNRGGSRSTAEACNGAYEAHKFTGTH